MRILSLGAGVQSTALLLLAAEGLIDPIDAAIFADTQWEPKDIYDHLERLEREVAAPAGIPIIKVSAGNLREESASEDYFGTILPLWSKSPVGKEGLMRRTCTQKYKLVPIYRYVRKMLGATEKEVVCQKCDGKGERIVPWLEKSGNMKVGVCSVCRGSGKIVKVGPAPRNVEPVEMLIGFSTDEIERVAMIPVAYAEAKYPLLDLNMSRTDCMTYLASRGWGETRKSACIGCPYHDNVEWRDLRKNDAEWEDACKFDEQIRDKPGAGHLESDMFLHRDRVPLRIANIDALTTREKSGEQLDLFPFDPESLSCSPFGCRSGANSDIREERAILMEDETV